MDLVKDAFAILYFLASADGSVDDRELQVIVDFINRQHGLINFDPHQTIADLARLTGEARTAAYDRALFNFRDHSGVQDRYTLMHFAADLVMADGAFSANEKILFQAMAKVWGIDMQTLFQQAKSYAAPTVAPTAAAVAAPAPAAPNAAGLGVKTKRAHFFAWSLGSALSLYALAAASLNSSLAAEHYEKARTAALGLGLYPEPLTGLTGDANSNRILMLVYLLNREGIRLANEMDKQFGAAVSAYFYIVVNAYILLLQLAPETYLESIARFKARTALPDEFFNPITSAVRQAVEYENLKSNVAEFDRSVSVYLYNRIDGEKNAEQNIIRENYQNKNDSKPATQTATAPNASATLSAPLEILAAYSQGRVGNNEVLRALISHRGWFAPLELFYAVGADTRDVEKVVIISQENQLPADSMCIFTDYESVLRASETNALIGAYGGEMSGTELFAKIPAGINKIRVNSYSPTERTFAFMEAGAVELARLWSEVITLEEQIGQWQPGKPDLKALGGYRGFLTVVNAETNGIFLMKEFDEEMRLAAPIFTAPDSAERFLANLPPDKARALKQITINGDTLLNDLPNMKIQMPNGAPPAKFDGAVINAFGPGAFHILPFDGIRNQISN